VRQVILLRLPAQRDYMGKQTFLKFPNFLKPLFCVQCISLYLTCNRNQEGRRVLKEDAPRHGPMI